MSVSVVIGESYGIVNSDAGAYFMRSLDVCESFRHDAQTVLELYVLLELRPFFFLVCYKKVAALIKSCGQAELFVEVLESVECCKSHAAVEFKTPLSSYAGSAASCRTGAYRVFLKNYYIFSS